MNKKANVLIIHGDSAVRNNLRDRLRRQGYSKIWGFDNTGNALNEIRGCKYKPDLLILTEELCNLYEILKYSKNCNAFTVGNFLSEEKELEKLVRYSKD